jgi:molybdenum cofactor cytidylyltransferase
VIVLPGCARSQRLNGLDWILRRLLAKLPLDAGGIAAMGVGGLIRSSPEQEEEATTPPPVLSQQATTGPRIAALVLAAGRSSRMGGANKLLEEISGIPLVQRAVNAALASRATSVTVVTGYAADQVENLIVGQRVSVVRNPDYTEGLATSLRRGIAALPADADGVVVLLGDMPYISAVHIDILIERYAAQPGIIVPMKDGRRGNPVLWPRSYFAEMQAIAGDQGARGLLARHAAQTIGAEMDTEAIFVDVDTPETLNSARAAC